MPRVYCARLADGFRPFRARSAGASAARAARMRSSRTEAGAQAGAAAKAGKSGAADTVGTSVHEGIEIYELTEAGALLAGTIAGTKYWKDADLN